MDITVVEINNEDLFRGAKVKHNSTGNIKEIFVLPKDKTISEAVRDGSFNIGKHVEYQTVMLNKHLFTLINED